MMPPGGNNGWVDTPLGTALVYPRNAARVWYMARSRKSLIDVVHTVRVLSETELAIYDETDTLYQTLPCNEPIVVDIAFDQLDRLFVTWQQADEIHMYWYNPVTQAYEILQIAEGQNPCCAIDDYRPIYISNSDIFLFYQRDDVVYYRVQRDRFLIEYTLPHDFTDVVLETCGMGTNLRFTVRMTSVDGVILMAGDKPVMIDGNYVGYPWGTIPWDKSSSNTVT